jgi:hypothetical protein
MRERAIDGGCSELATDNRLVGSSSPPSRKQRFPGSLRIAPNWRGFVRTFCLYNLSIGNQGLFWRLCLCLAKSRFPETETWLARDRFDYADYRAGSPASCAVWTIQPTRSWVNLTGIIRLQLRPLGRRERLSSRRPISRLAGLLPLD